SWRSEGNSWLSSISAARGATRSRASVRTRSRSSRCSSFRSSYGTARTLVAVVTDGLDVVAVGVEHVGGVVPGVILGPLARGAVVAVAGGKRAAVELVDGG